MNQPTQASPEAPSEASTNGSGVTVLPSLEERSNAAFGISEPAGDLGSSPSSPAEPGSPAASESDAAATERRKRLDALLAGERERIDAQARKREHEDWRRKAEEAERRAKEAEERAQSRIDISTLDEAGFFEMAERLNVTPQKLGEFIRKRVENPEALAAQAATRAVDPKLAALEKKLADQQAVIDRFMASQEEQAVHAQERGAAAEFNQFTEANAASAPYASSFLKHHGGEEFYKLAKSAAASVPPGSGWQAVLDVIEENLSRMAPIYAPPGANSTGKPAPPNHPAAAKAPTTVSNTLAQGRATVVDEEADWGSLSFEERSARLWR